MTFPKNITASHLIWFHPYKMLADNIACHRISTKAFKQLMITTGLSAKDGRIITKYYHLDQIMEVDETGHKICYVSYPKHRFTEGSIELVTALKYNLSPQSFPLRKNYHHERQAIIFTKAYKGYKLELEILLTGITKTSDRNIQGILDSMKSDSDSGSDLDSGSGSDSDPDLDSDVISLSYQLIAENIKDKDSRYNAMLETLRSMN